MVVVPGCGTAPDSVAPDLDPAALSPLPPVPVPLPMASPHTAFPASAVPAFAASAPSGGTALEAVVAASPGLAAASPAGDPGRKVIDEAPAEVSEAHGRTESLRWMELPPPYPPSYEPNRAETKPEVKAVAADVAYRLTNYELGDAPGVPGSIVSGRSGIDALESAAAPLLHDDVWSRGTIVYPQLGGLTSDAASVMVVVTQELGTGGSPTSAVTRTLDIRLVNSGGGWEFDHLGDVGGEEVTRPRRLSAAARRVLDDPRIHLPDSARWDIYRGHTSEALLIVMADLAEVVEYGVAVLSSGHPHDVFGTNRVSNHTVGRAVDVYLIEDETVVASRNQGSKAFEVAEWLFQRDDLYNFGSPWALDGRGGRSFSDRLHQDHFHIAVPSS